MYELGTIFNVKAEHSLPFEEGEEANRHWHDYRLEVAVSGSELDENGFLVDIVVLRREVEDVLKMFEGKYLNDLDFFKGRTVSLENFSKVLWNEIFIKCDDMEITLDHVKLWETRENLIIYRG